MSNKEKHNRSATLDRSVVIYGGGGKSVKRVPNLVSSFSILPLNALRRDCNDKYIELIEGHYLLFVVEV